MKLPLGLVGAANVSFCVVGWEVDPNEVQAVVCRTAVNVWLGVVDVRLWLVMAGHCSFGTRVAPWQPMREDKMERHISGRLRLNLNWLNLVQWIDSWPFHKTWKPGWNDSTAGLWIPEWIFIMTPSRARKSFSKASPYFFFVRTRLVTTGTDSMPFDYFARFQKIQPNEIHLMNLLHF